MHTLNLPACCRGTPQQGTCDTPKVFEMQTPEVTDEILSICQAANVQLMDGTMWSHSDRAQRMEEAIAARLEPCGMGPLKAVTCTFCFAGKC